MQSTSHTNKFRTLLHFFRGLAPWVRSTIIAALILVAAGIVFTLSRRQSPSKINPVVSQSVTEIKQIREFCTAHYCEETVVSASRKRLIGTDDIAIIVKGTVRVGYDLSQMKTQILSDTTIIVSLPEPKVLDVITNPSDCETFQESGHWSHKQVTKYKNIARGRILKHALADGIMNQAADQAHVRLQLLFSALGFKQIEILADTTHNSPLATHKP